MSTSLHNHSISSFLWIGSICCGLLSALLTITFSYYFHAKDLRPYLDSTLITTNALLQQSPCPPETWQNKWPSQGDYDQTILHYDSKSHRFTLKRLLDSLEIIVWRDAKVVSTTLNRNKLPNKAPPLGFSYQTLQGKTYRFFTQNKANTGHTISVAQPLASREYFESNLVVEFILLFLGIYLASFFFLFLLARHALGYLEKARQLLHDPEHLLHLSPDELCVPKELAPFFRTIHDSLTELKEVALREHRFAGDAAHELRTPLAALKTQAQLTKITKDPQLQQKRLSQIDQCIDRCSHTVNQLLLLAKASSAEIKKSFTNINLGLLIHERITDHQALSIHYHGTENVMIQGHRTSLEWIIHNILQNAEKYGSQSVDIHVRQDNDHWVIEWNDDGPGVADEHLCRLKERFFRVYGTKTDGSGIGLSIVDTIMQHHQGQLDFDHNQPQGLQVKLTFPMVKASQ